MCHPEHNKRIKPDKCLELYNSLISKYSSLKSGSKKNKKLTKKK